MWPLIVATLTSVVLAIELSMIDDSNETKDPIIQPDYSRFTRLPSDRQQAGLHNLALKSVFDGTPEGTDLQWVGQIKVGSPPQTL
jgi:hypothetical protein